MENLIKLLESVDEIHKEIKVSRNQRRESGDMFNIFEILKAEHYEVTTHSAILAELLNPNGSHGCTDIFLKSFLEVLNLKELFHNLNEVSVDVERSIGALDYENKEYGGRIDLIIHEKNKAAIIIENKIYADDQDKQLYRYCRYARNTFNNNFNILYLTLDGKEPPKKSTEGKDASIQVEPYCISYQYHIKKWIEDSIPLVSSKMNLQNSLKQYLQIINKLTNQDMNSISTEKLITLLSSPKNINNALLIRDTIDDALDMFMRNVFVPQLEEISKELNLEYSLYGNHWYDTYAGFIFYKKEWENFTLGFEFVSSLRNFYYGFKHKDDKNRSSEVKDMQMELLNRFEGKPSQPWWACYKNFPITNWNNEETIEKINNGQMKIMLKEIIEDNLSLVADLRL